MPDDERQKLDDLRLMLGPDAGNLAMVLEQLTDAMAMVSLHGSIVRVGKDLASGLVGRSLDVAEVLKMLEKAKRLRKKYSGNTRETNSPSIGRYAALSGMAGTTRDRMTRAVERTAW